VLLQQPDVSSICFAGIKRMEVPHSCRWVCFIAGLFRFPHLSPCCSYGVQLLWKQPLQLKHHQWTVLSRRGVGSLLSSRRWKTVQSIFTKYYTAEPLCSDEVIPALALLADEDGEGEGLEAVLHDTSYLYNTSAALARHSLEARCLTFVYWPGCLSPHPSAPLSFLAPHGPTSWVRIATPCYSGPPRLNPRVRVFQVDVHPVVLDKLSDEEATKTLVELRRHGFLFTRKAPSLAKALLTETADNGVSDHVSLSMGTMAPAGPWEVCIGRYATTACVPHVTAYAHIEMWMRCTIVTVCRAQQTQQTQREEGCWPWAEGLWVPEIAG
jgi:hypothetical protein